MSTKTNAAPTLNVLNYLLYPSLEQHHHSALEESGRMLRQVLQFTIAAAGGGGGADFQQYSERGRGGWRGRGRGGRDRG